MENYKTEAEYMEDHPGDDEELPRIKVCGHLARYGIGLEGDPTFQCVLCDLDRLRAKVAAGDELAKAARIMLTETGNFTIPPEYKHSNPFEEALREYEEAGDG